MAHLRSPFFQAQSRFQHAHSNSVTASVLSFYDSAPESDAPAASSSAPTTPAAGSSTVQSSSASTHRRTASALPGSASSSIRKLKQHRRNSAISKRSTSLPVPQPLASSSLAETPDVGPASATAHLFEFAPPPVLTLSPPPEAAKRPRRSAPRLRVANPSIASSTRRRTPAPSFVQPPSPPPPYSLYPSQSVRRVHVPTVGGVPTLPSSPSPYRRDVYTASPRAESSTFPINRTGYTSPPLRTSQVRPLPPPPSVPRSPSPDDSESDDPERRPSLPFSESGLSTTSATTSSTLTESESIHPFDSDEEEEEQDVVNIQTPSRDEQFDHLDSFLEFSSCSSSLSSGATTGPPRLLPRKFRPTSTPIVGTFDPTEPEYSRGTLGAGIRKQCKRIVATGKTKLVAVGRKRSGSTESVESALSSGSQDLDWADALEGTLFG